MRFVAETAGEQWRGYRSLAIACETARLSTMQAEAARLSASGLDFPSIAESLSSQNGRVGYQATRRLCLDAERRLRRAHPGLVALARRETLALLAAMRNVRACNPGLHVYRERLGTHDREPVRFASRLHGECVDDLMRQPCRFLRDLPALLKLSAEVQALEAAREAR